MENAKRELDFIKSLINENRKKAMCSGMPSILWGIFVIIALVGTFILGYNKVSSGWYYFGLWMISCTLGHVVTYIVESRRYSSRIETYSANIVNVIWFAMGVAMMIIAFVPTVLGLQESLLISPIMGTMLGSAYFVNGYINDYKWMKLTGVIWWISSILLFVFIRDLQLKSLLVFSGMMFVLQIIPGIKLELLWRKENL